MKAAQAVALMSAKPCARALARLSLIASICCGGSQGRAADPPKQAGKPICEIAIVSPVSGYAECVKPPGAEVEPPPARPGPTEEECRRHPELDLEACKRERG